MRESSDGVRRRVARVLFAGALTVGLTATACDRPGQLPDTRAGQCAAPLRSGGSSLLLRQAWIISAGALVQLQQAGLPSSLLQAVFNRPSTLVLVSHGRPDSLVRRASPTLYFTSAATMVQALRDGQVARSVRYLLLDLERWSLTPGGEQSNPIAALRWAASVAHGYGKCLVFAPAIDLVGVQHPGTGGSALYSLFDRSIAGPGAALSDVFVVQSQHSEATSYANTLAPQAIGAARAAHRIPVLAGLSTNPNGHHVSPANLLAVYRASVRGGGAGFWLNIPRSGAECTRCGLPQPQVAVAFLEEAGG